MSDEIDIFADPPAPAPTPNVATGPSPSAPGPMWDSAPAAPYARQSSGFNWWMISTLCLAAFSIVMLARGCNFEPPQPDGDKIAVDHLHVLLVPAEQMTVDQASAINSTKVNEWCEDNGAALRRYAMDEDLVNEDAVWRQMRDQVKRPPAVVIASPKRTEIVEPDGVDGLIKKLEASK